MMSNEKEKKIIELNKIINQNFKNMSNLEQQNFCNSISHSEDKSLLMAFVLNEIMKNSKSHRSKTIHQYLNEEIEKIYSEKNTKQIEELTDEIRLSSEIRLLQDSANTLEIRIIKNRFSQIK